jgi:hypothetical protein
MLVDRALHGSIQRRMDGVFVSDSGLLWTFRDACDETWVQIECRITQATKDPNGDGKYYVRQPRDHVGKPMPGANPYVQPVALWVVSKALPDVMRV